VIVDFISIKEKLNKTADFVLKTEMERRMPFVRMISTHVQHEGDEASYQTVDNETKEIDYQKTGTWFSLSHDEIAAMSYDDVIEKVIEIASDLAKQIEQNAFARINVILDEAGRTFENKEPISSKVFVDSLEDTEIDFDDTRDKPNLPTIVLHPSALERLKEQDAKMTEEEKQELTRREAEILDRKYEQYLSRENNRKLVD
jgi:hypothetical protein